MLQVVGPTFIKPVSYSLCKIQLSVKIKTAPTIVNPVSEPVFTANVRYT